MKKRMRGGNTYVPLNVLDEAESIMREDGLVSRSDGMRAMVKYARIGREAKRIMKMKI